LGGRDTNGQSMQGVNGLTQPVFCPTSKQPELKHAAVVIEAVNLPWQLVAMAWLPSGNALIVREAVALMARDFSFFSCVPFGNEGREADAISLVGGRVGVLLRLANEQAPADEVLEQLEHWFGVSGEHLMRYDDHARQQRRAMRLVVEGEQQRVDAFLMAGDVQAEAWVRPLLQEAQSVQSLGTRLLFPSKQAPGNVASRGKQICTCFNVTAPQIVACLPRCAGTDDQRLAQLQGELKCGTNCGSCVPALRKLIRETPAEAMAAH
jgi:assimilatory nitrate reductase catalytic subunit